MHQQTMGASATSVWQCFLVLLNSQGVQSGKDSLLGSDSGFAVRIQKKSYEHEANLMQYTSVELAKKSNEIVQLKIRYGNLLKAISISFEVGSGLGDALANSINPQNAKGSILNLFS